MDINGRINKSIKLKLKLLNKEAIEATKGYVSLFEDSRIININTIINTPSDEIELVDFQLADIRFSAISNSS